MNNESFVLQCYNYSPIEPVHSFKGLSFNEAEGPMIYSRVDCEGWENDIRKCSKLEYEDFTCPHYTVAGVLCSNGICTVYAAFI